MTTPLDNNAVRKLDAIRLVEGFVNKDAAAREQILSIYSEAAINDHGLACFELAFCCALLASQLLEFTDNGEELLQLCRARLLGDNEP